MGNREITIISPPLPLLPLERQVSSLTFFNLTYLIWYPTDSGKIVNFPEFTQHIFRTILNNLPITCHYCDQYSCISPPDKLDLSRALKLARVLHKDITSNIFCWQEKFGNRTLTTIRNAPLDKTADVSPVYRLTISFSFFYREILYIPHREFILFSLPADYDRLLIELKKVFGDFVERYSSQEVHILVTLQQFQGIQRGFISGIIPIAYQIGTAVGYNYDPVDWSWVDNDPIRDPSNRFFIGLSLFVYINIYNIIINDILIFISL